MAGRDPGKRKAEETSQPGADAKKTRASDTGADIESTDVVAASRSSRGDVSGSGSGGGVGASLAPPSGAAATQGQDVPQGQGGRLAAMNTMAPNVAGHLHPGPRVNLPLAAAPLVPPRPLSQLDWSNLPPIVLPPLPPRPPTQQQRRRRLQQRTTDLSDLITPGFLKRAAAAASPEDRARVNALAPLTSSKNPFTTSAGTRSTPETLPLLDKINTVHGASVVQQAAALSSSGLVLAPGNMQLGQPLPQPQQLRQPEPCPYCHLRMGTIVAQPTAHGCLCAECLANSMAVCPVCGVRGNIAAP